MNDFEHDELRALNAVDDIRQACGLNLVIDYSGKSRQWTAGLNDHSSTPVQFGTVDEAIDWAYWYAGA